MDSQLEATYEGPEAVQRRQLTVTMVNDLFLAQFKQWMGEMRRIASERPGTGACTLATAMDMWLWTITYLQAAKDANGVALYHGQRQGVAFPMADALSVASAPTWSTATIAIRLGMRTATLATKPKSWKRWSP